MPHKWRSTPQQTTAFIFIFHAHAVCPTRNVSFEAADDSYDLRLYRGAPTHLPSCEHNTPTSRGSRLLLHAVPDFIPIFLGPGLNHLGLGLPPRALQLLTPAGWHSGRRWRQHGGALRLQPRALELFAPPSGNRHPHDAVLRHCQPWLGCDVGGCGSPDQAVPSGRERRRTAARGDAHAEQARRKSRRPGPQRRRGQPILLSRHGGSGGGCAFAASRGPDALRCGPPRVACGLCASAQARPTRRSFANGPLFRRRCGLCLQVLQLCVKGGGVAQGQPTRPESRPWDERAKRRPLRPAGRSKRRAALCPCGCSSVAVLRPIAPIAPGEPRQRG